MLDTFLRTHHEICLVRGSKMFTPDILRRVEDFLQNKPVYLPEAPELSKTRHVQTHNAFFQRVLDSTYIAFRKQLSEVEKCLFEAIILHRMTFHFMHPQFSDNERRSHSVLVAMCKQKLVELFLDLDPKDIPSVLKIGALPGIRSNIWNMSCDYAHACAQTIEIISELDECWMYLPSVYESYMLGIDLFVFSEKNEAVTCLQVKQANPTDKTFQIERVRHQENVSTQDSADDWTRRLQEGMARIHEQYPGYVFHPCQMTIPYTFDFRIDDEVKQVRNFFLFKPQRAANTDAQAA
ncbi:hypothetical protein A3C09_02995 [Candidatus Uhrbacteria bacterium RIFCSPHIGHO2_02_FULL_47_44]|uniref:Uncharacterized protein n=1 Tax=Candidatus Uhrbacteria bacterium RIFCSPLOWO2_02_FULL_48_18 TaxID=1802408 RepID=A0A1F7VC64_9BACT|nr:MAG: hypothetical protein A2839_05325 [Candidatus Uhrbacteria bacterium RIFCSPHIGHO2_01_FULL_47_10]OGL70020.1 MAG: hypothetical protein A3C09_02995 [Candidatus Uhrbacteria bacterium RIFCSPHIGHO2_02_FULL_47_44]OGL77312.1 MAG: hypothetical protein A3E97_04260 [Candidatus Uhrbacteria bacterium RIFCSPHIGHO2_12_FULL_47_12]OGL80685.1 MAG: hypothetical protein A3B20_04815 [Candidatus Uhrbacteria bacterium RIFCSPLOWO2_01_FULL_47_17]OGL88132.1 MAG: hypothetical protein A3I41_00165 [Candidatus Uhrbact